MPTVNAKYSYKNLTGRNLSSCDDLDGQTIIGTCLSNEVAGARVLPDAVQNLTFINCNLDNVFIPEGVTLIDCSNRFFAPQIDGYDWVIDMNTMLPIEPFNKKQHEMDGLNTDPALIAPREES